VGFWWRLKGDESGWSRVRAAQLEETKWDEIAESLTTAEAIVDALIAHPVSSAQWQQAFEQLQHYLEEN
jgi:hypothetical protein